MAEQRVVTVTYDPEASPPTLTVGPSSTTVEDHHDQVHWVFENVPENDVAMVTFADSPPFGPFQFFAVSRDGVKAIGNTGVDDTFTYTATILTLAQPPGDSVLITSASATVVNEVSEANSSPFAQITVSDDNPPDLLIEPQALQVFEGGTAIWRVTGQGLSDGRYVTLSFNDPPSSPEHGPFAHVGTGAIPGSSDQLIIGTDFHHNSVIPEVQIGYLVTLRDAEGNFITSNDPAIEPLGPPP